MAKRSIAEALHHLGDASSARPGLRLRHRPLGGMAQRARRLSRRRSTPLTSRQLEDDDGDGGRRDRAGEDRDAVAAPDGDDPGGHRSRGGARARRAHELSSAQTGHGAPFLVDGRERASHGLLFDAVAQAQLSWQLVSIVALREPGADDVDELLVALDLGVRDAAFETSFHTIPGARSRSASTFRR